MIFSVKLCGRRGNCAEMLSRWSSFELSCALVRGATVQHLEVAIGDLAGVAFAVSDCAVVS
jgi:hypothetical protein